MRLATADNRGGQHSVEAFRFGRGKGYFPYLLLFTKHHDQL